jgi:excisionase family DNA binding protein
MIDQNSQIEPMLTTSEVAQILNVHINTVRRWSNQGVIKSYRIGSRGDRRFRREDINALFNKNGGIKDPA